MKREKKVLFDVLIKRAVKEEFESSPPPLLSKEEAWENILQQMNKVEEPPKRTPWFKQKWMYVAAILLCAFAITMFSGQTGLAKSSFTEFVQRVQGAVLQIFVDVENPINWGSVNENNTDEDFVVQDFYNHFSNLQIFEAQEEVSFPIYLPEYVPNGYKLIDISVMNLGENLGKEVYLYFESKEKTFRILQREAENAYSFNLLIESENAVTEKLTIMGNPANFIDFKNGQFELVCIQDEVTFYSIRGELSKNELIQIAESMKPFVE